MSAARDEARNAVDAFIGKIELRLDGQTLRAAQRFGLIAYAGELAVEFGIVPWEVGSAAEVARGAFDRWLEARGGVIPYEARRAVAQVRHFIEAHGDSRFEDLDLPSDPDRKPVLNRAGYREGKGENRLWYVRPEVWHQQVCEGLDAHDVAKTLVDLGMLEPGADKLAKPKKAGGKTQRFYALKPEIFEGWGDQE
ncbi:MAG TPA: hypothetical protein VNY10_14330 [Roseiarcus sp.]|nr:hypothetical protein [Roseiarcus sp.]